MKEFKSECKHLCYFLAFVLYWIVAIYFTAKCQPLNNYDSSMISHIKRWEQFKSKRYNGRYIGYGHAIMKHDKHLKRITRHHATILLIKDYRRHQKWCKEDLKDSWYMFNDAQRAALTDIYFNYGRIPKFINYRLKSYLNCVTTLHEYPPDCKIKLYTKKTKLKFRRKIDTYFFNLKYTNQ